MRIKTTSKKRSNAFKDALRYAIMMLWHMPILDVFTIKWGILRKQSITIENAII
jgi:hypothetical protein